MFAQQYQRKPMELIFGRFEKQYLIRKTLNKEVWLLENTTSGQKYVGKFQSKNKLDKVNVKNVLHEASFLQQMQGHTGVPLMYWSGVEGIEILVISQYLGFTLQQRLQQCGGKFSIKTTCMLGLQILKIIRNFHQKGIIHRNITPTSVQFGRGFKSSILYMNDLIDCKRFRNKKSYIHIPAKKNIKYSYENIFGSRRFHSYQQTSRIDDIENLIKVLIYFSTGVKPKKKGQFENKEKIPKFLNQMIQQCHKTQYAAEPNYQWFVQKLNSQLYHSNLPNDGVYDWMVTANRIESLKISKYITSLKLDQDKQILAEFYEPYEQSIDIDEVTAKHHKYYEGSESRVSQHAQQNLKGLELEAKIKKKSSLKRQKADCRIF